jgi:D-tyrosyl-tRNA(Tyr) deacylase
MLMPALVSQFTLYGTLVKGKKPDFHKAMSTQPAREMYHQFLEEMRKAHKPERIQDGQFGAMMQVALVNDGPVTLQLDSRKFVYAHEQKTTDKQA